MEEEKKSKRGLIIGAVAVGVMALGVGAYLLLRGSNAPSDGPCKQVDFEHQVTKSFSSSPGDAASGEDVVFSIDGFCEKAPVVHDSGVCVARWSADNLKITGNSSSMNGTTVLIQGKYPVAVGHTFPEAIRYKLGSGLLSLPDGLVLYEGTTLWIDINDPLYHGEALLLDLDGLCIVENIDGGDILHDDPSEAETEPVMANTGRADTTKVKRGS